MDCHGTGEVGIAVGGAQTLVRWGPLGGDPPTAHNMARLYLEDVSKIAAERDLELKDRRLHAVVEDVEVLVHAPADGSAEDKAQGARRDRAVLGEQSAIAEKDTRCVVAYRAAVEQLPGFAIGINAPAADNPSVEEIEALL